MALIRLSDREEGGTENESPLKGNAGRIRMVLCLTDFERDQPWKSIFYLKEKERKFYGLLPLRGGRSAIKVVLEISSGDVNDYIREISGGDFTAKDFRTWAGTMLAAEELRHRRPCDSVTQAKKNIIKSIDTVAKTARKYSSRLPKGLRRSSHSRFLS